MISQYVRIQSQLKCYVFLHKQQQDLNWIQSQFQGQLILNFNKLCRADENNWLTGAFHSKFDGIGNTLTIAKTQYDRIIDDFTTIPWSTSSNYSSDTVKENKKSFLFRKAIRKNIFRLMDPMLFMEAIDKVQHLALVMIFIQLTNQIVIQAVTLIFLASIIKKISNILMEQILIRHLQKQRRIIYMQSY